MPPKPPPTGTRRRPERHGGAAIALELEILREIPIERSLETVLYRAAHIPPEDEPDPLFALRYHGRWPTEWTLYTGSSEAVAWAEYCRNHATDVANSDVTGGVGLTASSLDAFARLEVPKPLPRRSLYALTFGFEALADLTSPWAEDCLRRAGFDTGSFHADAAAGYGDCPELAGLVDRLGWEAMRVPSAAWPYAGGWCVPVFAAGRPRLLESRQLLEAASPTVALAVATAYPQGRRPAWLGAERAA